MINTTFCFSNHPLQIASSYIDLMIVFPALLARKDDNLYHIFQPKQTDGNGLILLNSLDPKKGIYCFSDKALFFIASPFSTFADIDEDARLITSGLSIFTR